MAALNVTFSLKPSVQPSLPRRSFHSKLYSNSVPFSLTQQQNQIMGLQKLDASANLFSAIVESVARASFLAFLGTSLFVDPALAFKSILPQANFRGAKLLGASFFDADLTDFTDVPLRDDQLQYLCKVADGLNPTTGNRTRDTLLCK